MCGMDIHRSMKGGSGAGIHAKRSCTAPRQDVGALQHDNGSPNGDVLGKPELNISAGAEVESSRIVPGRAGGTWHAQTRSMAGVESGPEWRGRRAEVSAGRRREGPQDGAGWRGWRRNHAPSRAQTLRRHIEHCQRRPQCVCAYHVMDIWLMWGASVIKGMMDVAQTANFENCKLSDVDTGLQSLGLCTCGDEPYTIPASEKRKTWTQHTSWYSGLLMLNEGDGSNLIVWLSAAAARTQRRQGPGLCRLRAVPARALAVEQLILREHV